MRVTSTRLAKTDILRIRFRIAHDNPRAADKWVRAIRDRVRLAGRSPRLGRKVPELDRDDIREGIVGNYRIVYRIRAPIVEILRVFEGHMPLPQLDE
jgi:plasmid stabilization system protein ParE